jgi:bifunctional DNA-binding transcriptional regulator/antitoxin component of YhaV-PrlF toxin-antitoxin module
MQTATLNSEEQVRIPKSVQDALGVGPGDQIGFEIREDGTVLVRAEPPEKVDLLSLRGILKPRIRVVTVEDMNETIRNVGGSGA